MRQILSLNNELKIKILDFLYEDELFNVFLIHFIENQIEDMGELYINESNGSINSILHLKFDGNSYFTSFFCNKEEDHSEIAKQLKKLNYNRVLLSGKRMDVSKILAHIGKHETSDPDIYYKLDVNKYVKLTAYPDINFRNATCGQDDIDTISEFMIGFFQPANEQEIEDITNKKKLLEDIKIGVYFIEYKEKPIGMARYSGKTKKYIDITTVYIEPSYRGKGFGKILMQYMVNNIISANKVPVTQTSSSNYAARRTYEALGFVKQDDYSFEFIS